MSALLVDTHIALWALAQPERLTAAERALMTDDSVERCLSPISIWEVAIKREAGRLKAPADLSSNLVRGFRLLDISGSLFEAAAELPRHHRDPFDRVLIAHALEGDMAVVTRDAAFAEYGVRLAV